MIIQEAPYDADLTLASTNSLSFRSPEQKNKFWRMFSDESVTASDAGAQAILQKWETTLSPGLDRISAPDGYSIMYIGSSVWDELKLQKNCTNCGAVNEYTASNCANCTVGKPHLILVNQHAQATDESLLLNTDGRLNGILPAGFELVPVGSQNITEIVKHGSCIYCGAPITFFIPNCTSCGRAKPYIKLSKIGAQPDQLVDWSVGPGTVIVLKAEVEGYLSGEQIEVSEHNKAGVCKAHRVIVQEGASLVSALGIEVSLEEQSQAEEIKAIYVSIKSGSRAGRVIVYDGGRLFLGEGATIDSLVLGKNVTIEIQSDRLLSKHGGTESVKRVWNWLGDRIRSMFSGIKKGESSEHSHALPGQVHQKGKLTFADCPIPEELQKIIRAAE